MNTEFMLLAIYNKPRLNIDEVSQVTPFTSQFGLFDMERIEVLKGPGALEEANRLITNDLAKATDGQALAEALIDLSFDAAEIRQEPFDNHVEDRGFLQALRAQNGGAAVGCGRPRLAPRLRRSQSADARVGPADARSPGDALPALRRPPRRDRAPVVLGPGARAAPPDDARAPLELHGVGRVVGQPRCGCHVPLPVTRWPLRASSASATPNG